MASTRHIWAGFATKTDKNTSCVFILSHAMLRQCHRNTWMTTKDGNVWHIHTNKNQQKSQIVVHFFPSSSLFVLFLNCFRHFCVCRWFKLQKEQNNREQKVSTLWWVKWCTRELWINDNCAPCFQQTRRWNTPDTFLIWCVRVSLCHVWIAFLLSVSKFYVTNEWIFH